MTRHKWATMHFCKFWLQPDAAATVYFHPFVIHNSYLSSGFLLKPFRYDQFYIFLFWLELWSQGWSSNAPSSHRHLWSSSAMNMEKVKTIAEQIHAGLGLTLHTSLLLQQLYLMFFYAKQHMGFAMCPSGGFKCPWSKKIKELNRITCTVMICHKLQLKCVVKETFWFK